MGLTNNNFCFISLITKSDNLAKSYHDLIYKLTGLKKITKRNKRDNAYNIILTKESAQILVNFLYYENCISINRKFELAKIVKNWKRPDNMKKITHNIERWSKDEIDLLKKLGYNEFMKQTYRTKKSVKIKLYRIICKNKMV